MRIDSIINAAPMFTSDTAVADIDSPVEVVQRTAANTSKPPKNPNTGFRELNRKQKHELSIDEAAWVSMVNRANKAITGASCSFEYSIHERTKEIMVKVINKDTKEVIREIPPEKILDLVAKLWEIAGILVDERR